MEELQFRIPKQTDENLIRALTTIRVEMARDHAFGISVAQG